MTTIEDIIRMNYINNVLSSIVKIIFVPEDIHETNNFIFVFNDGIQKNINCSKNLIKYILHKTGLRISYFNDDTEDTNPYVTRYNMNEYKYQLPRIIFRK